VYDEMGDRDLCSCYTMIFGYAKVGKLKQPRKFKPRKLFNEIPQREYLG
jgi:hypothetical protein